MFEKSDILWGLVGGLLAFMMATSWMTYSAEQKYLEYQRLQREIDVSEATVHYLYGNDNDRPTLTGY